MKYNLSKKITLPMIILVICSILFYVLLVNLALFWNFGQFLDSTQEEQNRLIVDTLTDLYSESTSWHNIRISTIHVGSTTNTQIKVFDLNGHLITDSLPGMMHGMHGRRRRNMFNTRSTASEYPLYVLGQRVGTVEISHLGQQGIWTTDALVFRRTVQLSAIITGLAAIIAATFVGSMLSKRLTKRLTVLTTAAENWGHDSFKSRVLISGDDELAVLGTTMNSMATRLEEQSAFRRKYMEDISHELRTPLTTTQSYLEAFLDGVLPTDKEHLQAALEESRRLGRLVTDLQELTNTEFDAKNVQSAQLILNTFIAREAEHYRPLLAQKNIELKIDLPKSEIAIRADERLIVRIIDNLLSNAAKYTPEGGYVRIALSESNKHALIIIEDTGIGIEEGHLPNIFERFYRVDPSRTRATGGSGIGLSIVKELTEAMGGRVDVTSTVGKGSSFRLYFPFAELN